MERASAIPLCFVLLAQLLLAGCAATPFLPKARDGQQLRLLPSEPLGVETLAVAASELPAGTAYSALRPRQLASLWRRLALPGPPPALDFRSHVAVAWVHASGGCREELLAMDLSTDGRLRPLLQPAAGACATPVRRSVHVVALARLSLPAEGFVLAAEPGAPELAVRLTGLPAPRPPAPLPPEPPPWLFDGELRGIATIPPPGQVEPALLEDGTGVWIAHHADGQLDVLASDVEIPAVAGVSGLRMRVPWLPGARRLGDYDEYGVYLYGRTRPPLERHEFQRLGKDLGRIWIGRRMPGTTRRLLVPRGSSGSEQAVHVPLPATAASTYTTWLSPHSLIQAEDGPLRLCAEADFDQATGCPEHARAPKGLHAPPLWNAVRVVRGPLLVRTGAEGWSVQVTLAAGDLFSCAEDYVFVRQRTRAALRVPRRLHWEVNAATAKSSDGGWFGGATARLGVRWVLDDVYDASAVRISRGRRVLEALAGDLVGVELVARVLAGQPQGQTGVAFTVGIAPALSHGLAAEILRVPAPLSFVIPEIGILVRSYAPLQGYFGFSAPMSLGFEGKRKRLLVTPGLLLSPRAEPAGGLELLGTLSIGVER